VKILGVTTPVPVGAAYPKRRRISSGGVVSNARE
jgi:hypothetical protein